MLSASLKRPLSQKTVLVAPVRIHDENTSSESTGTVVSMADAMTNIRPPLKRMKCSTLSDMNENSSIEFDVGTFTTDQSMEIEDGELASMNLVDACTPSQDVHEGLLDRVAQAATSSCYSSKPNAAVESSAIYPATGSILFSSPHISNIPSMQHKRKLRYSCSSTISSCSLAVSQSSIRTERSASNDEDDALDVESDPTNSSHSINEVAMNDEDPVLIETLVADWSHSFVLHIPKQQRSKSEVQAARRVIHRSHFLSKKQSSLSL